VSCSRSSGRRDNGKGKDNGGDSSEGGIAVWDFLASWPLTFAWLGLAALYLRQRERALTLLMLGLALFNLSHEARPTEVWLERLLLILGYVAAGLGLFLQWRGRGAARAAAGQ
jgi:hypothetical protein